MEQTVAEGERKRRAEVQDDAASDGAESEENTEGNVHRLPLVGAAAGLVCVVVSLLEVRRDGGNNICLIHLDDQQIVDGEGQIDEGHQLENQVEDRSNAGTATVETDPAGGINSPNKKPGEENQNEQEDSQEHMMRRWPCQS